MDATSTSPPRPVLSDKPSLFMSLEREVQREFRPLMLAALQQKVDAVAESMQEPPQCPGCGRSMTRHDAREVSWVALFGKLLVRVPRYKCKGCSRQCRPLLDFLGVEPGRINGSLARLLAVLAVVAPYTVAARLVWLLLSVRVNAMTVWRAAQRLGQAAASYSEALSQYHADSRGTGASTATAPAAVILGVDGCVLGMQVRTRRRRRKGNEILPPLPAMEEGHFREVKTGVMLLPGERVETSPGRRSVVRKFLVSCLGNADEIFGRVYAQLRELGWVGPNTVVVIVGDGAEWIWNRATQYVNRCEILDYWHALERAWEFARLRHGVGSQQADRWVRRIGEDLRAGKVDQVLARLRKLRPQSRELQENLEGLIRYYSANSARMRYDEYLRLGYGIGSGCVESAHKQVIHARFRQAGMRWSQAGARRLLALRLLLLNDDWAMLDRLRMVGI